MSTHAPFALSRAYKARVENGDVTLTRISGPIGGHVWMVCAILIAAGTPAAAPFVRQMAGAIPMFLGVVLFVSGAVVRSSRSSAPIIVEAPRTIRLRAATAAATTQYREPERATPTLIVDGETLHEPEAVLVLVARSTKTTAYIVTVVTPTRVMHVETTNDVLVANALAADLRESLGLPATEAAAFDQPSPDRYAGPYVVGILVEVFALPVCIVVTIVAPNTASVLELIVRAAIVGVGFVVLDVLVGTLATRAGRKAAPEYLEGVRALCRDR